VRQAIKIPEVGRHPSPFPPRLRDRLQRERPFIRVAQGRGAPGAHPRRSGTTC